MSAPARIHRGRFIAVGWACALLALALAMLIVLADRTDRRALREQVRERNRLKLEATKEYVEDYIRSIRICLRVISLDPNVIGMQSNSCDHIQAIYEANYAQHRMAEIYVVESDFDGARAPVLRFEPRDRRAGGVELHSLDREAQEYATQVDHIRCFRRDRSLTSLLSRPIRLCIGGSGIVYSVPIRQGERLVGIVSGMVPVAALAESLEAVSVTDEVLLANTDGTMFSGPGVADETRAWFRRRLDVDGAGAFFSERGAVSGSGSRHVLWEVVDIAGDGKWCMAYVYDEDAYLRASGVRSDWAVWSGAGTVALLGVVAMVLCRMVPAVSLARAQADRRARALAVSEARTHAIVDTAVEGIITTDERGVIELFNTAAGTIFACDPTEAIGMSIHTFIPGCGSEVYDERAGGCARTGRPEVGDIGRELEGRRRDGTTFPVEAAVSEVVLPGKRLFTSIVRDISERKRAEAALRESEQRYRTLVENIDLGVTLVDADYTVVMTNAIQGGRLAKPVCAFVRDQCLAAAPEAGLADTAERRAAKPATRGVVKSDHEAIGTSLSCGVATSPSRCKVCSRCPGTQAMATGRPTEVEVEHALDDGSRRTLHIRAFPIPAVEGNARGFIEVVEDVTERRRCEAQARNRQAELAHMGRLATLGEMAAGLAHELNQPLSAIVNYVQACVERLDAGVVGTDELRGDMEQAAHQAVRAGEIIERLRHFVGRPKPQRTTVNVNTLVREVVDLMEPELRHRGVQTHLRLDDSMPPLEADGIQIQQVLVNLIRNGQEAMASERVDKRHLTITTSSNGASHPACTVEDTGPGIPDGADDRVFDPFFTTKRGGMGVGLSISRRIIESHGGRLWASSRGRRGATFRFTLPIDGGRPVA